MTETMTNSSIKKEKENMPPHTTINAFRFQDLAAALEAVRICAVGLSPVTPRLSKRIYLQLGFTEEEFRDLKWVTTSLFSSSF